MGTGNAFARRRGHVEMTAKARPTAERNSLMSAFPAITHVAVTVTDLSVSVPWYTRLIGAEPVLDEDTGPFRHVVYAIGGTLLGLHAFPGGVREPGPFHPHRAGLDHV